jgi:bifunctional UDP-N-acetylglucosamine pyrophosphorylase/glucosamine-1-phosphate N-acetyltransferase
LRINRIHQEEGVTIIDSTQTYIESDVKIGKDTVIWPYTFLKGKTKIGENCVIENGAVINNSIIESNVKVKSYSVIEDSKIKNSATVGPFTRLRPNSVIGEKSKIGNFVEIKKSV